MDSLAPAEIVDFLIKTSIDYYPSLQTYGSVILFFTSLKRSVGFMSGGFLNYTGAYAITKMSNFIEYLA